MTETSDATTGEAPQFRVPLPGRVVAYIVLAAIVGGALGMAFSLIRPRPYRATTQVQVLPDPTLPGQSDQTWDSPELLARFIDGEALRVTSPALRRTLRESFGASSVKLSAAQVEETNILAITASGSRANEVVRWADAAAKAYAAARVTRIDDAAATAAAGVEAGLAAVTSQLTSVTSRSSAVTDAQRSALQSQYADLLTQREQIRLSRAIAPTLVTVVRRAAASGAHRESTLIRDGVLGALLGLLVGLGIAVLFDRRGSVVSGVEDVLDIDPKYVLPALPASSSARVDRWSTQRLFTAGQLIATRVSPNSAAGSRAPLVVFGATRGVGTSFVATAIAAGLARQRTALLVCAGDVVDGSAAPRVGVRKAPHGGLLQLDSAPVDSMMQRYVVPSDVPQLVVLPAGDKGPQALAALDRVIANDGLRRISLLGYPTVIDAPPLDESLVALELMRSGARGVLVVAAGRTPLDTLIEATQTARHAATSFAGVVVNRPGARRTRRLRRGRRRLAVEPGA